MTHPALARALAVCAENLFARSRLLTDGTVERFTFGPPGTLLLENVLREWQLSCVLDAPNEMFPFSDGEPNLGKAMADARTLHPLPIGVTHSWIDTKDSATYPSSINGPGCTLIPARRKVLCASVLVPAAQADRTFHGWQQHRAIWWRKLSSDPGRYATQPLPEPDSVAIRAAFAWGSETVETITLRPAPPDVADAEAGLSVVRCETSLETAAVSFLCDAMDGAGTTRLHRRLAPYKIGFVATAEEAALAQLARFLCRQLRESGTSCLLAPSNYSNRPGEQITETLCDESSDQSVTQSPDPGAVQLQTRLNLHDSLGVPFTLVLGPDSLRTGVAALRSRDSSLQEQIHVTDLKTYVELLLKNY